jgi:hypothetical protein
LNIKIESRPCEYIWKYPNRLIDLPGPGQDAAMAVSVSGYDPHAFGEAVAGCTGGTGGDTLKNRSILEPFLREVGARIEEINGGFWRDADEFDEGVQF